ncbi:hypothetical protein RclHR1_01960004 [Rhizophagus clarus]|uniref:S-adenosyl-L-methionine-dependent methyltransferase n=1 Tax=Rhizophagus clarus TaxID=94130 RepID=A0A2Z6R333_9GLOM|nr:hypothetical protein RclHR1_01960004 [Rhizophagus clarus]GES78544.1 S-adenosyl-L-methionine-dependent methyltransferase [Rhizophagus clarus]
MLTRADKESNDSTVENATNSDREEFRYIDGIRFHNVDNALYPLPNDDEECDRLHMQHFIMKNGWQSNFNSPVKHFLTHNDSEVLDAGCGAGSWAFDIASSFPRSKVTGIDISPIQPSGIKPKNFTFIQANLLDGLPFKDNTFDFIFQRFLIASIAVDQWPTVMNELIRILKPGGYLELMEFDLRPENLGPVSTRFAEAVITLCLQQNCDINLASTLKSYFEQQNQLKDVKEEIKLFYGGAEAGKLGRAFNDDVIGFYKNIKVVLMPILQTSSEEYDQMLETAKKEWLELNSYFHFIRVYARKE